MNYYHSEVNYQDGLTSRTCTELNPFDWYYGEMTRVNAEKLLSNKSQGAFLVRISESYPSGFALSVKHLDTVQHFIVLRDAQGKFFLWDKKFSNIIDLIDYYKRTSISLKCDLKLLEIVWKECFVQAKYDFTPQELGELEFKRGEIITVIERANDTWWRGLIGSRKGLFPSSYVIPFHT
ncbi:protein enhancer of sevenless 2B [Copidosoma floridanum]|uniref:protein enhancer of sevenless 2B n=1 Tax=Copidosoma floridanum TaxID=29053 RepID=UPI000C6F8EF8|nr:protein enhancer of sevenless 2B [Copidosoma floridanum]